MSNKKEILDQLCAILSEQDDYEKFVSAAFFLLADICINTCRDPNEFIAQFQSAYEHIISSEESETRQ